jgi:hypothetical protein
MKSSLVLLPALALGATAFSASSIPSAAPASPSAVVAAPPAGAFLPRNPFPPRQIVFFAYVKSLTRSGSRYVMRVDPAAFLSGVTANRAAIEDKVIAPGEVVPNDYYIRDEGHRLLTYRVPATAHITILTAGVTATPITVAELARAVKGKSPKNRPYSPNGFWIRARGDTVLALDQQYRP